MPWAILTSREAAEEFARSDPFVLHGVVRRWYIRSGTRRSPNSDGRAELRPDQ